MGASSDYVLNISQRVQGNAPSELQKTLDALNQSAGAVAKYEAALDKLSSKQTKAAAATALAKDRFSKLMDSGGFDASSGIAQDMAKDIAKAEKAQAKLAERAEETKEQIKAETAQVEKLAEQYEKLKKSEDGGGDPGGKGGEDATAKKLITWDRIKMAAKAAWEVIKAVAKAVWDVGEAFVDSALSVEKWGAKFENLLPGVGHGTEAYRQIVKLAADYGLEVEEASGWAEKLFKGKFNEAGARPYLLMAADLKAIGMEAGSVEAVIETVAKINKAGTMGADSLSALGNAGLDTELIIARLSSTTGKSVKEIEKALQDGKIKGSDALKIIQEVASPTGIGAKAAATATTLGGMWARMKGHATEALTEIAIRALPKLQKAFGPLVDRFTSWLDSPASGEFFDSIATKVGAIAEDIKGLIGDGKNIGPALSSGIDTAVSVLKGLSTAAQAVKDAYEAIINAKEKLFGSGGKRMEDVGPEIATRKGGLADQAAKASKGAAGPAKSGGVSAGVAMANGMVEGLNAGTPAVEAAAALLAQLAAVTAMGKLEAHSPSKLFARIGKTAPDGMVEGIRGGIPRVQYAVSQLVGAPAANSQGSASQGMAVRGSGGVTVTVGTIVVHGSTGQEQMADLSQQVGDIFLEAAREAGVAA